MTEWQKHQIVVKASEMLPLMARSLYPRPEAALREILANAVDALTKRRYLLEEQPGGQAEALEVQVAYDESRQVLVVTDTGIGMDWDDVINYVNQIGRSGTREFGEEYQDRDYLKDLIGQFGIGLLACFKLGNEVRITTRKVGTSPDEGVEWKAEGLTPTVLMRQTTVQQAGTEIEVCVTDRDNADFLRDNWRDTVKEYGDLLPYPIRDRYTHELLNSYGNVPWETDGMQDDEEALKDYVVSRARTVINPPIWVIPITPGGVAVRGVIYVPDDPTFVNLDGAVDLYCKRMLVRRNYPGILPDDLLFCHGVLDGADLTMTMNREDVMRNSEFRKLRDEVARQIYSGLTVLAAQQPRQMAQVQQLYDREIKHGVLNDRRLYDALGSSLRFFTSSRERQTLSEYVQQASQREYWKVDPQSEEPTMVPEQDLTAQQQDELNALRKTIIYVTSSSQQERYQVDRVLQQRRLRAIEVVPPPVTAGPDGARAQDIEDSVDFRVLKLFANNEGLELIRAEDAFEAFPDEPDERFAPIVTQMEDVLRDRAVDVRVSRFLPADLPVLLQFKAPGADGMERKKEQFSAAIREFQRTHGNDATPDGLEELLELAAKQIELEAGRFDLIINANNPIVEKFADVVEQHGFLPVDERHHVAESVAIELYHSALQYNGYRPDDRAMGLILQGRVKLLDSLLELASLEAARQP